MSMLRVYATYNEDIIYKHKKKNPSIALVQYISAFEPNVLDPIKSQQPGFELNHK